MRVTPLGAILLTFCTVFVLSSILFMKLSLMVVTIAILAIILYSRTKFLSEIERTSYEARREILDKMVFADETTTVKVEIVNKMDRTLSATFEDLLPADCTLKAGDNKVDKDIAPASIFSFSYSFAAAKRGLHTFRGLRISRVDSFGLFDHEESVDLASVLNVHTNRQSLEVARRTAGSEHLEYSGWARSPAVILREFEFDGLRDYDYGDRARDIHWKSFPRFGRLMTKVYRKEGALQTMVMVDCSSSMRLSEGAVAKLDHAVDLAIQISNVLLSNMHPSGIALFDEVDVLDETMPGLGRHQFERVITALRNAPGAISSAQAHDVVTKRAPVDQAGIDRQENQTGRDFMGAVESIGRRKGSRSHQRLGLEGEIARVSAIKRSQQKLFVILTDLTSCRESILAGAKLCKRTNNKMLVINTYTDWYGRPDGGEELSKYEQMYDSIENSMMMEKVLRRQGVAFLRIGPADTAPRIVRTIRRGLA